MRELIIDRLCDYSMMQELTAIGISDDAARAFLISVPDKIDDIWDNEYKFLPNPENWDTMTIAERLDYPSKINPKWQEAIDNLAEEVRQVCNGLSDEDLVKLFERTVAFAAR